MNLQDQLNKVKATKAAKQLEISNLLVKAIDGDETPNDEAEASIATLEEEVATLEKNVERISKLIADSKQNEDNLEEVTKNKSMNTNNYNKSTTVTDNLDKGIGFAKYVRAKMQSARAAQSGDFISTYDIAKSRNEPEQVLDFIKAVTGSTTDAGFGSALVQPQNLQNEFVELLRANTAFDKLTGQMVHVPFNSKIASQLTGGEAQWVAEGAKKPTTNPTFGTVEVKEHKLAAITLMTDELLRNSSPSVDKLILNDLVQATASKIDATFLDALASDSARPEGLLNGVTALVASGRTATAYAADIAKLKGQFITNNLSLSGSTYIMSEVQASEMAELRDAMGNPYFRGMDAGYNEKVLGGIPVVETQNAANKIVLVKASELLLADDGGVQVDYSNQATVAGINLWEENKFAIRVERFITWAKRRPIASSFIQYS